MLQEGLAQDAAHDRMVVRGLDAWNGVINGAFENLTIDATCDGFEGAIDTRRFGGLDLSRIASSPALVRRHRPSGGGGPGRYFKLHIQETGSSLNVQDGQEAVLGPGDLMLCDSSRPYSIRFDAPNRMLVLRLPEDRVAARFEDPDALVGRRLGVESLGASLLSAFVHNLWTAPAANDDEADCEGPLLDAALNLLAAANGFAPAAPTAQASCPRQRIRRFVDEHLTDPELSVTGVARALGLSPRYVQMAFAEIATTPLAYIRRRRLQLAAQQLRRQGAGCNITELGFSLGFNDLSHFSRAFKARYGVGPREYRAA
ncbi:MULTISPECIES: helix-turn-helix domain-containing protein [unclassified Phenylobacterium]|uniref:AraC-like ligand-binding domain-containing protein n=1 Tax=unclassified Phenylobacterium TaxID=2640670 RepID=UPI00083A58E5|nr:MULTISPECIES: helix-turn-helix domain-containing protein [unclassified Phenylobacterium]